MEKTTFLKTCFENLLCCFIKLFFWWHWIIWNPAPLLKLFFLCKVKMFQVLWIGICKLIILLGMHLSSLFQQFPVLPFNLLFPPKCKSSPWKHKEKAVKHTCTKTAPNISAVWMAGPLPSVFFPNWKKPQFLIRTSHKFKERATMIRLFPTAALQLAQIYWKWLPKALGEHCKHCCLMPLTTAPLPMLSESSEKMYYHFTSLLLLIASKAMWK